MKIEICENCKYVIRPEGKEIPDLICSNKASHTGRFVYVNEKDTCRNFKPDRSVHYKDHRNNDISYIPLTQGKFAIVDTEDYELLRKYKWHVLKTKDNYYACRNEKGKKLFMHRIIINAPKDMLVDHKDNNSLNNRRSNLRFCNYAQNARNRKPIAKSSKYKGVTLMKGHKKWNCRIKINNKPIHLGCFTDETEAAKAYDKKAAELFGEFAYLNFPKSK